ncbi:MAG: adenylate/guanylate cyclase domain-containing protein, partial [Alphaproteobacteria bacterium]|nr:adenylate/guanylate cyclase domain-containing protein [Alphaproteobacteria bacterium]
MAATEPADAPSLDARCIVMIDVIESVRLMQADEQGIIARWRAIVEPFVERTLPDHDGTLLKSLGDGLLLEFGSVDKAVRTYLALCVRLDAAEANVEVENRIRVRAGMHVGTVVRGRIDVYGETVNLAARLMTLAGPGEIVCSAAAHARLHPAAGLLVEDLGERLLRNVSQPVQAFRLYSASASPAPRAHDQRQRSRGPSIAVVPLRNQGGDPKDDYLADGVVEDIIAALSRFPDFFVIS